MNKKIQRFVKTEKWDKLYNYLKNTELPIDDLNASYKYTYRHTKGDYTRTDSLLTISVQRERTDVVEFLLKRGCNTNPSLGIHPMIALVENIFSVNKYEDFSEPKLAIIKMILAHAHKHKIKIDLNSNRTFIVSGADHININYLLHMFCSRKTLNDENKAKDVFKIIELFIKNGAEVESTEFKNYTVFDNISDPKILDKLLETASISPDFIQEHISKYKEAFKKMKIKNSTENEIHEKNCLRWKINILSDYLDTKLKENTLTFRKPIDEAFKEHNTVHMTHVTRLNQGRANISCSGPAI